jgi:hypothetical protein
MTDAQGELAHTGRRGEVGKRQAELTIGPARSFEQLCQAFHLVYMEYLRHGYQTPNASQMRYSVLQLLPTSRTFVATAGTRVVGTGTIVVNSSAGLPSTDIFGDVFKGLERQGRVVAEATLLACADIGDCRANSIAVQLMPSALAWVLSRRADDLCVVVNPRHLRFWENVLGLEVLGEERPCGHVSNHPGILLRAPLREFQNGTAECTAFTRSRIIDQLPHAVATGGVELLDEEVAVLLSREPRILGDMTHRQRSMLESRYPSALWSVEQSFFESRVAA